MSMKEIENANTMEANAARVSVYTIHKYTTQQQQACGAKKFEKTHKSCKLVIDFSIRRDHELSTLRTFCRLNTCVY